MLPLASDPSLPAIDTICRGQPLWLSSQAELVRAYPPLAPLVSPGRAYRVSCLPLVAHGRTLGALALTLDARAEAPGSAREQNKDSDERDFLLLVARYASQALERLRLFEAERRSRAHADEAGGARSSSTVSRRWWSQLSASSSVRSGPGHDRKHAERAAILVFDAQGVMRFRAWRRLSDNYRRSVGESSSAPTDRWGAGWGSGEELGPVGVRKAQPFRG